MLTLKDIGASQLITEGKIKLKNDSAISHFNENSIEFEDGSTLAADVVIFSTGCVESLFPHDHCSCANMFNF